MQTLIMFNFNKLKKSLGYIYELHFSADFYANKNEHEETYSKVLEVTGIKCRQIKLVDSVGNGNQEIDSKK